MGKLIDVKPKASLLDIKPISGSVLNIKPVMGVINRTSESTITTRVLYQNMSIGPGFFMYLTYLTAGTVPAI